MLVAVSFHAYPKAGIRPSTDEPSLAFPAGLSLPDYAVARCGQCPCVGGHFCDGRKCHGPNVDVEHGLAD